MNTGRQRSICRGSIHFCVSEEIKIHCKFDRLEPAENLKPHPHNPRTHPAEEIEALARVIRGTGWRRPVTVSKLSGFIVRGHGALAAAKVLGCAVPVEFQDFKDDAEETAHLIADNRLAELAEWNNVELAGLLKSLDGDLDLSGFDLQGMNQLIDGLDLPPQDAEPQMDRAAELNKVWQVKSGDLWRIGEHRLLCGDSTKREDVERVMGGEKAGAGVTDPPYGIVIKYSTYDDSPEAWFALMDKMIPLLRELAKFVIMPCCQIRRMDWWYANHKPDWLIAWYKGSPGQRSAVGFSDWEPHLVWGKPPNPMHDYFQSECGCDKNGHPCPKPLAWATWLIERAASVDDILFDPFLGSGTTMVACENLKRKCRGIEISPNYCAVVLQRMKDAFSHLKILRGDA